MFRKFAGPVACAALLLACSEQPTTEGLIAQARQHREKGELTAAAIVLKNVLQQDPGNGHARFELGMVFRRNGEPRGAEHHFRQSLKANYDAATVLPQLAQALFEQGEFEKLLDATRSSDFGEAALQPAILSLRGHAQMSLGRNEAAAASFQEALKRKPEFAPALLGEVRLAQLKGDMPQAHSLVERALASDPASLDAWLMKGDLERTRGNAAGALAAYQKALELNPLGLAANLNLASFHLGAGSIDEARKHIATIIKVFPNGALGHYLLGIAEFRSRNLVAAAEAASRAQKLLPDYLPATALAGVIAYSRGANDEAEKYLAAAVARSPGNAYLRKVYAAALIKAAKPREAIKVLEPLAAAAEEDPSVLVLLGEARLRINDSTAARKYFERAARHSPKDPRARTGLGLARLASGETERALADLEAAAELGAGSADSFLARYFLSVKELDKALAAATRLEGKRPNDAATFNLKGTVLFAQGNLPGARAAFERAAELQPGRIAAAVNLAHLDARENKGMAARRRFEKMVEREPENVQAMLALSDLSAAAGNLADAESWAQRAIRIRPKAFAPSFALARLLVVRGDFAKASVAAQNALSANPNHAEALNILGYCHLRAGNPVAALDVYTLLASRNPGSAEAHYGLSTAQSANGRLPAAERSLERALKLRPNFPEAMYALATLQLRAGRVAEARKVAEEAKRRLPEMPLAAVISGDAAMAEKRYAEAVRSYEAAFSREASRVLLVKLHGALRAAGRAEPAHSLAMDWLRKYPDDIQVRYVVAEAAIRDRDFGLAAQQYEHALRKEPNRASLYHNLVRAYEQMNDPRALEVAEKAYKVDPDDPGVIFNLGRLLLKGGDAKRAVRLLEKARVRSPDSQLVRYTLATAYVQAGANGSARLELEQLLRGRQEFAERAEAEALLKKLSN